jgi:C4-dicarboxylate transporter, DctM subunit
MALMALVMFSCFLISVPIGFALGTASLVQILSVSLPLTVVPQRMFSSMDEFVLISIPFFILAGLIMNEGGLTSRLVRFSQLLIGRIPYSLSHVTVTTSMIFGGICGAAVAEASAVGAIMIPAMEEDGYTTEFSAALTAAASTMGPIIPPSIPMIVFGVISGSSVGALFLAGAIPGILIGIAMMCLNMFLLRKQIKLYRKKTIEKVTKRDVIMITRDGLLALIMPVIIVGGIINGVFTPTESAIVAVFYAFFVGYFIFRKIKLSKLPQLLLKSAVLSSVVMFIIAAAGLLAWVLASAQVPQEVGNLFLSITKDKNVFIILVIILLIFTGFFMGPTPALVILAPVLLPGAVAFDINVIHFGTIMVIGLVIGLITPPVGSVLFIICGVAKISLVRLTRAIIPFLILEIFILLLVGYLPFLSLWLPKILKAI